jgi:hypothetical protein
VLLPEVTVTTSSLEVSGSTISVNGKSVGKPLIDATMKDVFDCPCAWAAMDDWSEVSTAVDK